MQDNDLEKWAEIMRMNAASSKNERNLGRKLMEALDEVHPLNETAVKICDVVSQVHELMLTATQTRGIKTPEEAAYLHENMVKLRTYLNGLQETVTLDWPKE